LARPVPSLCLGGDGGGPSGLGGLQRRPRRVEIRLRLGEGDVRLGASVFGGREGAKIGLGGLQRPAGAVKAALVIL
jgi:hypothetical protein